MKLKSYIHYLKSIYWASAMCELLFFMLWKIQKIKTQNRKQPIRIYYLFPQGDNTGERKKMNNVTSQAKNLDTTLWIPRETFKGMEKTQTCKGRMYTLFVSGVNKDMEVKILCRIVQPESTAHMLWCVGKWGWRLKRVDWGYAMACFGYRIILSCPKSAFFDCLKKVEFYD